MQQVSNIYNFKKNYDEEKKVELKQKLFVCCHNKVDLKPELKRAL